MKKYIVGLLTLITATLVADAARVSATRAAEIASDVLKGACFETPVRARSHAATVTVDHEPYYVFNATDRHGYVIVAGDDRLPAVLGYSTSGYLDMDNAPDALIALLDMSVSLLDSDIDVAVPAAAGGDVVVQPLLGDIAWGQDEPFNTMCLRLSNGTQAYVGCVATAMTQIMRYYGYPQQGEGSHSYTDGSTTLVANFGQTAYDWDNMPNVVPDNPTDAQIAAYSTLCSHVGIAVEMQYAAGGSGAYTMMVPNALRSYFGYSRSVRMHSRSYYNTDEWMSMIRSELDASRPVYYAATSEDGLGGHAFVCDGYDSEGYVHINWGWYGRSNGYFYINHLNPGELGTGGGSGAYNLQQEIITDFKPRTDSPDPAVCTVYGLSRFVANVFGSDMMLMSYFENLDTDPFNGEAFALLTDNRDNIICTLHSVPLTIPGFNAGRSGSTLLTMNDVPTACPVQVPDGDYRLHYGYRMNGSDDIHVLRHTMGLYRYADCKVRNNVIVSSSPEVIVPVVAITDMHSDGDIYAGCAARFIAHLNNLSDNMSLTKVNLKLTAVDNPDMFHTATCDVNIYDLSEADVEIVTTLPATLPAGEYHVTMYHEGFETELFSSDADDVVTIHPEAATPILRLTGSPYFYNGTDRDLTSYRRDDKLMISLPVRNYGSDGSMMILLKLNSLDNPEYSYVLGATNSTYTEWTRAQYTAIPLATIVRADAGRYSLAISCVDSSGHETPIEGFETLPEVTIVDSDNTPFEVTEIDFPTAIKFGESVECSLTIKGLQAYRGSLYVRIRRYTYTDGEIVYMTSSVNLSPGESKTFNFKYRPGTSLTDGMYLIMVEGGSSSNQITAAGHSVYYREVALGEVGDAGVDTVTPDDPDDILSYPVEWYDLSGRRVGSNPSAGIYLRRQGSRVEKVYIK